MISWQSIMSVFNTKGTLLKWLKTLDETLKDGVLQSVTVNTVSAGVITLTFNFADGSAITTPQIELPEGERGPQGVPGADGADGADGTNGRDALVQNRALSSANISSPMAVPIDALNRTAVVGEPIVMFATDTTENKTYMLIGTVTSVGSPGVNPYVFVTYSNKIDITGPQGAPGFSDVPIPTDEDNGKVLGVANGAYALQEAGGGDAQKKLYTHYYHILSGDNAFYPVFIFDFAELFTNLADLISYLYNKYGGIVACYINGGANIGGDTSCHISEIYALQSNSLRIDLVGSKEQYRVGTAGASLVNANCKVYEL